MMISPSLNIIIVSIILNVLMMVAVILRFRARHLQRAAFGVDDWTIVIAALLALTIGIGNSISVAAVAKEFGMASLTESQRRNIYTKVQFAVIITSVPALAFTKYSIISFYRRIFRSPIFLKITLVLLIINVTWGVSLFFATLLQCSPVYAGWDSAARAHARCYSPISVFYCTAISDAIIDFVILILPQPIIWRLQMPKRQKVAVSGILLIGAFIVGVSAARIYFFIQAGHGSREDSDPIRTGFDKASNIARPSYWTYIECTVAVICACLPTMRIIFLEISVENFRTLRSLASKISLRTSSQGLKQGSVPSLPRRGKSSTEANDASFIFGTHNYHASARASEGQRERDADSIVVYKTVDQIRTENEE